MKLLLARPSAMVGVASFMVLSLLFTVGDTPMVAARAAATPRSLPR